jgi:tetratricopeptide (TPR) repeat protein
VNLEEDEFLGTQAVTQSVHVESGFGYGVIGADLHVFQDRGPIYLLAEHRKGPGADAGWLLAQPSRLLDARYEVVDFTGRRAELTELAEWRDAAGPGLSARWLHGPGGQGKTRLAAEFAGQCAGAGYKVVTVAHGPGSSRPSPGSQDMRLGGSRGLLVVVEYADRWPASHLSWLFSNELLHHKKVPVRLLLLARSARPWPAVRAALADLQADVSEQHLRPLPGGADPGERHQMFTMARDCFAACYGITRPGRITAPGSLSRDEFGLILTLHMAALAAVDAHANGLRAPQELPGLSAYLLDRERRHWTRLYENRAEGLEFQTPPEVMSRAVFTAALTGAASHQQGTAILNRLGLEIHADRLLADHGTCYPPADPGTVMEPLYPDRLAEDFLALTLPGHTITAYQPRPWAPGIVTALTARDGEGASPPHAARMITFLAAAAQPGRWPHVAATVAEILEADPESAIAAGGPVLTALADVSDLHPAVLAGIEPHLPDRPHTDLDLGIAALTQRLTDHRLTVTTDPAARAGLHTTLSRRYANAGLHAQAATAAGQAVAIHRTLADTDPAQLPGLTAALDILGRALADSGNIPQGLSLIEEAVAIRRRLAETDPAAYLPDLATSLHNLSRVLPNWRHRQEAVAPAEEALAIRRRLADTDPAVYLPDLATSLSNAAIRWAAVQRADDALAANDEALAIRRRLADTDPAVYLPDLATSLNNRGSLLFHLGRHEEAVPFAEEAVAVRRGLADTNPASYQPKLATSLHNLGVNEWSAGRAARAAAPIEEAVAIWRKLAEASPAAYLGDLALSLDNLGGVLDELGSPAQAVPLIEEAVAARRTQAEPNPGPHLSALANALARLGNVLSGLDRIEEALAATEEAVTVRRKLAQTDPGPFLPLLGLSLSDLFHVQMNLGQTESAAATAGEGVSVYRMLADRDPAGFRPLLASALFDYGTLLLAVRRTSEALIPIEEAVMLFRALADADPDAYLPHLAQGLVNLRAVHASLGNFAAAAGPGEEAVMLFRALADADPDAYLPYLARALHGLAGAQSISSPAEALTAIDEATKLYTKLARQDPDAFQAELRATQNYASTLRPVAPAGVAKLLTRITAHILAWRFTLAAAPIPVIVICGILAVPVAAAFLVLFFALILLGIVFDLLFRLPRLAVTTIRRAYRSK